jgi:uncharacterized protein
LKFWDTSAIVPLFTKELNSGLVAALEQQDPQILVWWGSRVETYSAIRRKVLSGHLSEQHASLARIEIEQSFSNHFVEINPSEEIRRRAESLISYHDLRAADALQLAAFLDCGLTSQFVTLDQRLREAATFENADVYPT